MARQCEICGKGMTTGGKIARRSSHVTRRTNRAVAPNIQRVKAIVNGTPTHVRVCTRCIRSGKVQRAI